MNSLKFLQTNLLHFSKNLLQTNISLSLPSYFLRRLPTRKSLSCQFTPTLLTGNNLKDFQCELTFIIFILNFNRQIKKIASFGWKYENFFKTNWIFCDLQIVSEISYKNLANWSLRVANEAAKAKGGCCLFSTWQWRPTRQTSSSTGSISSFNLGKCVSQLGVVRK